MTCSRKKWQRPGFRCGRLTKSLLNSIIVMIGGVRRHAVPFKVREPKARMPTFFLWRRQSGTAGGGFGMTKSSSGAIRHFGRGASLKNKVRQRSRERAHSVVKAARQTHRRSSPCHRTHSYLRRFPEVVNQCSKSSECNASPENYKLASS